MATLILKKSDGTHESFMKSTTEFWTAVVPLMIEGNVVVSYDLETISDKAFRALHLWFRQCETQLNKDNIPFYGGLSGKPRRWREGDFKAGVYKPFLRLYKDKESTKDQQSKDINECLEALTGHIATEYASTLPPFPCIENMSLSALLGG